MTVIIRCGTCKKHETIDDIKASKSFVLGFHICQECLTNFKSDFGLDLLGEEVAENVSSPNLSKSNTAGS